MNALRLFANSMAAWLIVYTFMQLVSPSEASQIFSAGKTQRAETLAFTKNMGQWPDSILFRACAGGATMWFTRDGIYYQYTQRIAKSLTVSAASTAGLGPRKVMPGKFDDLDDSIVTTIIKAEFTGANPAAEVVGIDEQQYKCNYFIGNDPGKWRTDVPNYSAITMKGIYGGVDITFRGQSGVMSCEQSGSATDLAQVRIAYREAQGITFQQDGSVMISTCLGQSRFLGILPVSKGTRAMAAEATSPTGVTLVYSTYLGGGGNDVGYGIAVDRSGNAYVAGQTYSSNFPLQNPFQAVSDSDDAFVTKLSSAGSLIYSTYLGGKGRDQAAGIDVDGSGCAYVTGTTPSSDFPMQNPLQDTLLGYEDVFVTKLSSAGDRLIYSTYLGGYGGQAGRGITVDGMGSAYVTGYTTTTSFPTRNPFQVGYGGNTDAFVAKLTPAGNSLVYSTFLGGNDEDYGYGIEVDRSGYAYVTGSTASRNFPTQNPFQATLGGRIDAFVTKVSAAGDSLIYSTYAGGSDIDRGCGIAVDANGCACVTGHTASTNLPTYDPLQPELRGNYNAFVMKLSSSGSTRIYSTYLGGRSLDNGLGVAVDKSGNTYVTGYTLSTNFPIQNPFQATKRGVGDAFVTKLSPTGTILVYSTYLGGGGGESGQNIAVDSTSSVFVTGYTFSSDFVTQDPFQATLGGVKDAFVTRLGAFEGCCIGTTGNADGSPDSVVDIADILTYVGYLTLALPLSDCPAANDANRDGRIDISDIATLIDYLVYSIPLPACP